MHLPDQHPIGRGPAPRHLIRILLTALSAGTLFAQTSEISGRILDASKGALASVKITLKKATTTCRCCRPVRMKSRPSAKVFKAARTPASLSKPASTASSTYSSS